MSILSAAKGLAIAGSLWASGAIGVTSIMTIPALLLAPPDIAVKQFRLIYGIGYFTQPPLTLLTTMVHGFIAYHTRQSGNQLWTRWATAAAFNATLLPWTFVLMEPVSHHLLFLVNADKGEKGKPEMSTQAKSLLNRWSKLNIIRGAFSLVAGMVGLWTCLETA
ncbi:hypothetical protein N7510_004503 [Penicillium lagena]|uniref:uncharacterized protein n=1 Tax=Penicillium lagena TaxID=94218 RepID=UPI00253F6AF0|nr:uncharacterized protein N7510_004503 [Penicillium lagena]KAJ5620519.1 hypothetical protein N7510_004503 [Penicillium lagena]